jgi:hypothetical protein
MKKLILISALTMMSMFTYGQHLQKGNFIGFHVMTINLDPNVTMNQFIDFYKNKLCPAYASNFQAECYMVSGIRGESVNSYGVMMIWKSEADRDKYFNKEGGTNENGKAAMDKLKPLMDELAKLGSSTSKYTDWVVK